MHNKKRKERKINVSTPCRLSKLIAPIFHPNPYVSATKSDQPASEVTYPPGLVYFHTIYVELHICAIDKKYIFKYQLKFHLVQPALLSSHPVPAPQICLMIFGTLYNYVHV